jgi:outer membrane protein assembly factor BamD
MNRVIPGIALTVLVALGLGCSSGIKDDPILVLSSAEALEEGKKLMADGKHRAARDYLTHAFEIEPNSVGGREALLLAADAYFLQGGVDNLIRAESKYRDFQTRFPTSQNAGYVQFQIAKCLSGRVEKPDRDQAATIQALEEYRTIVELYPTSQYVSQAMEETKALLQILAAHELQIGRFYFRYGNLNGATQRLNYLLDNFPDYEDRDHALYLLGMTHRKARQAEKSMAAFVRLESEHPDSPYVGKIPAPLEMPPVVDQETSASDEEISASDEN